MGNLMLKLAIGVNNLFGSAASTAENGLSAMGGTVIKKVLDVMKIIMPILFAVVTVLGVAYGVILGINYAKAEDTEKREEAKKRLVAAAVGFGIAIVVSAVLWILANQTNMWYSIFGASQPSTLTA